MLYITYRQVVGEWQLRMDQVINYITILFMARLQMEEKAKLLSARVMVQGLVM